MITILVVFRIMLVLAFVAAVLMGLIAVSPIFLGIIFLLLIDILMFKLIFGKKKRNK